MVPIFGGRVDIFMILFVGGVLPRQAVPGAVRPGGRCPGAAVVGERGRQPESAVEDFRRPCRAEHVWLFAAGVCLVFVAFVALAVFVDVVILRASVLSSLLGGLLLLVGSMVSVFASAVTRAAVKL